MPDPIRFSPEDFDTGFIDNPSVAEDNHRRKYSSIPMPTSLLYGLVGAESWAPEWVRKGDNQSIEGLAYEWINGRPFFKESPNQNQGMLNDLMSTLMSFATVTDIATFRLGGAVGKLAIGTMLAKNATLGIKAGVSTKTAKKALKGRGGKDVTDVVRGVAQEQKDLSSVFSPRIIIKGVYKEGE